MPKTATQAPDAPDWEQLGYWPEDKFVALRKVKPASLRNERCRGGGPPFARIGREILYPIKECREWLAKQVVTPKQPATLTDGTRRRRSKVA